MSPQATLTALALAAVAATSAPAGQLHVFTSDAAGFNTHSVWYDDGKEVTVVDTQFVPAIAEKLLADIQSKTKSPVKRVIVSHPSPDKFNALSVFHTAGATSIASAATAAAMPGVNDYKRYFWINIAKAFTADTYPKFEGVKETFSGQRVIKLASGETITLKELSQGGIASTQTVVRFDKTGDVAVGDMIHHNTHAWLEGGIVGGKAQFNLAGWQQGLKEIAQFANKPGAKAYGGRGEFVAVKDAVAAQSSYLSQADQLVNGYVASLGERKAELADPKLQGGHHAALQAQFAKAFPAYKMPDLVGYSIYGWLGSLKP